MAGTCRFRRLYSGSQCPRLWRGIAAASALAVSLCAGGCSMSGQFDSLFGDKSDSTASITPPPGTKETIKLPPDADLAYARAAASAVLGRGEKDTSMPWENPQHRRAWHRDTDRLRLHPGWTNLPRFPGELCLRRLAGMAAGRSMQAATRRSGKCARSSPGSGRRTFLSFALRRPGMTDALHPPRWNPTLMVSGCRHRAAKGISREFGHDARPLRGVWGFPRVRTRLTSRAPIGGLRRSCTPTPTSMIRRRHRASPS